MKIYISLVSGLFLVAVNIVGCEKNLNSNLSCDQITLNKPFKAKIGDEWCIDATGWKITFGPFLEDSRCNVSGIECVWAGRFVMAATIDNGEAVQDTFFAVNNWQDTLYQGAYTIFLTKVHPETRITMEPLDASVYSFDVIVR